MKIFISHSFDDENLALKLKKILEKDSSIEEAYMAQRSPDFDIEIADKITREIKNSDYLIALITTISKEKPSVHQELGYAQGVDTFKIPLIEKDVEKYDEKGVLLKGRDAFLFEKNTFENTCNDVLNYIVKKGPRPKFSKEDGIYIQKSAHFRYAIRVCLDDILDSMIYRLRFVSEDNRDLLQSEDYGQRMKVLEDIFEFVDKDLNEIEKFFINVPLDSLSRFSNEFFQFQDDVKEANESPHHDLFSDELDALQKFNKRMSDIEEGYFDIQKNVQVYFEDEKIFRHYDDFADIMEKHQDMVPTPLRNYFRMRLTSFVYLTKTIVLLDQEIEKLHEKFGNLALKDTFV